MAFDPNSLSEILEKLGLTLWIEGHQVGLKEEVLVGSRGCTSCQRPIVFGVTFKGDGGLCHDCIDEIRRLLFQISHSGTPPGSPPPSRSSPEDS